jgi:hypothetical protein
MVLQWNGIKKICLQNKIMVVGGGGKVMLKKIQVDIDVTVTETA